MILTAKNFLTCESNGGPADSGLSPRVRPGDLHSADPGATATDRPHTKNVPGRELRDSVEKIGRVLIATPTGSQIPLSQVASIKVSNGPPVLKTENSRLNAWIFVDIEDIDVWAYVMAAQQAVAENVKIPPGVAVK